jgi:hypothetical protein
MTSFCLHPLFNQFVLAVVCVATQVYTEAWNRRTVLQTVKVFQLLHSKLMCQADEMTVHTG